MPTTYAAGLLDLDLRAGFFQLFLHGLGVGLVHALLDRARNGFNEVLRFLEAEARQFANNLDDSDLLVGRVLLEDDGELRLLLSRGRGGSRASDGRDGDRRSSGDTNFFSMSEISSTTCMMLICEIASRISSLLTAIVVTPK